jgi:hypothetical protein
VITLLMAGCLENDGLELWPIVSASIAPDGGSVEITAFARPDPNCREFDHIATKVKGDNLVISLYYRRTSEFCNIPCPLGGDDAYVAQLDPPVSSALTPKEDPATPEHCSEQFINP